MMGDQEREILLTAENISLTATRDGEASVLSFSVPRKGIHGVLGPVGAGKGELLRILACVDEVRSGSVLLDGQRLSANAVTLRKRIGYVPAKPCLEGTMTVAETLAFAGAAKGVNSDRREKQIREALSLLALEERKNRLVSRLTEAELWRLTLAVALLGNPELLLLEEPLASLGEDTRESRVELLGMLGKVKTVVLSTASFGVARELCEDVLLLSDGGLLAKGSFDELEKTLASHDETLTLEDVYRQLCGTCAAHVCVTEEEVAE